MEGSEPAEQESREEGNRRCRGQVASNAACRYFGSGFRGLRRVNMVERCGAAVKGTGVCQSRAKEMAVG